MNELFWDLDAKIFGCCRGRCIYTLHTDNILLLAYLGKLSIIYYYLLSIHRGELLLLQVSYHMNFPLPLIPQATYAILFLSESTPPY